MRHMNYSLILAQMKSKSNFQLFNISFLTTKTTTAAAAAIATAAAAAITTASIYFMIIVQVTIDHH